MSKYSIWYEQITEAAKNRTLIDGTYVEVHHIIPKSLGGTNKKENLVRLTAREHFICHWLLTKIHKNDPIAYYKMINAMRIMRADNKSQHRYNTKITSKVYEKIKSEYSVLQSAKVSGVNNPMYGKKQTTEAIAKIKIANTGRIQPLQENINQKQAMIGRIRKPFSDEWKENLSKSRTGEKNHMYGKKQSTETKNKIREKAIGRKQDPEMVAKRAESQRGRKCPTKLCIYCGKEIAMNAYERYHNNNCKQKDKY